MPNLLPNPLVPWHLWGGAEVVEFPLNVAAPVKSVQIAKVSYARPETWRFLFAVRILAVPAVLNPAEVIIVDFDLTVGIGRYSTTLGREDAPGIAISNTQPEATRGFARFRFEAGLGPNLWPVRYAWLTSGRTPPPNNDATPGPELHTDQIVAQDIQCRVRAGGTTPADNQGLVRIQTAAYFSPNTHVRADWFADAEEAERFRGNETGGS